MNDYLRSVLNAFRDLIFIFDDKGVIVDYLTPNQKDELIVPKEVFLGKPYREVLPEDVGAKLDKAFRKLREGAPEAVFDYTLENRGEQAWYSAVVSPVGDETSPRFLAVARNITRRVLSERASKKSERELEKINDRLNRLNRQKDKLFSVVSHDLRNSVAGTLGLIELMTDKENAPSGEELENYLQLLQENTRSQHRLLEDLLLWSQTQFRNSEPVQKEVNIRDIAGDAAEQLKSTAAEKKIAIDIKVKKSIRIIADPNMLKTIFRNLLSNAIKFSHPGGKVVIDTEERDDTVVVSVADEGVGMDEKTIGKIFRNDSYHTTRGTAGEKGSGLGLDICIDFVTLHGGTINAESTPGKGSTFYFTLPKQPPE